APRPPGAHAPRARAASPAAAPERRNRLRVRWPPASALFPCPIEIDDVPLVELVRAVERPFAEREREARIAAGDPPELLHDLAGNYLDLPARAIRLPSRALLDEPRGDRMGFALAPDDPCRGKAVVLGCTCGIIECWFLQVQITVLDDVVIWSGFEQFHRPWIYALGPFVFDKPAYLQALAG
ncbi:MAG: hypothetical protein KDK70_01745, partial [Myxococcales bacterium]|nr:hypothetical protein [Myxococcales bacterium]